MKAIHYVLVSGLMLTALGQHTYAMDKVEEGKGEVAASLTPVLAPVGDLTSQDISSEAVEQISALLTPVLTPTVFEVPVEKVIERVVEVPVTVAPEAVVAQTPAVSSEVVVGTADEPKAEEKPAVPATTEVAVVDASVVTTSEAVVVAPAASNSEEEKKEEVAVVEGPKAVEKVEEKVEEKKEEVVINRGVVDNQDTPVKVYVTQPSEQTG